MDGNATVEVEVSGDDVELIEVEMESVEEEVEVREENGELIEVEMELVEEEVE